jgi:hypothetical protein
MHFTSFFLLKNVFFKNSGRGARKSVVDHLPINSYKAPLAGFNSPELKKNPGRVCG